MLNCLEHLELYLKHCIQTVEFSEFLAGLDMTCSMEYNSSMLYKYIDESDHRDGPAIILARKPRSCSN